MTRRRTALLGGLLLALLVAGVALLRPNRAAAPGCDPAEVFAVLPVNREFAGTAVILSAYGRSEAALAPGDTLCLKLEWAVGVEQPGMDGLRIELRDSAGTLLTLNKGVDLSPPATSTVHTIPMPADAAGGLTITLTPLSGGEVIGTPLDVTTITVRSER